MTFEDAVITLKNRKELFVSGHTGSSFVELRDVMCAGVLSNAAWKYVVSKNIHLEDSIVIDFILNWLSLLLSITVFGECPLFTLLIPFFIVLITLVTSKKGACATIPNTSKSNGDKSGTLTVYRSTMLVMTSLAILAVDFPVFPRKYAKVETWGISLMDLGVGSFVFSSGIVNSKKLQKNTNCSKIEKILHSLRSSFVLLGLGIIRLLSVKASGYQEHVTEYGVHWNFFFTLSLLPIIMLLLENMNTRTRLIAVSLCLSFFEFSLINNPSFLDYLLESERTDFLSSNREGIFSFIGYCTIYFYGQMIGTIFFPRYLSAHEILVELLKNLIFSAFFTCFVLNCDPLGISRRFANLSYCTLVVTFNLSLLVIYHYIFEFMSKRHVVPTTLDKVNNNGMLIFLASNILTGLINMSVNTLDSTTINSMLILTFYAVGLATFALYIPFKIKI